MGNLEVKIFLLRQNIKQRDLAAHLGVSEAAISRFLSGDLLVAERLDQIANYLGLSPRKLNRLIGQSPSTTHPKEAPNVVTAKRPRAKTTRVRPPLSAPAAVSETPLPIH